MLHWFGHLVRGLVLPAGLICLVLGSIIFGWATPTQSGAVGAAGGLLVMALNGRLTWRAFADVASTTALMTAMVLFIIIATAVFSYPFRYFDGDQLIVDGLRTLPFDEWGQLGLILSIIFVLGFFLDWIEITVISLPLFIPVLLELGFLHPRRRSGNNQNLDGVADRTHTANVFSHSTIWVCVVLLERRGTARCESA